MLFIGLGILGLLVESCNALALRHRDAEDLHTAFAPHIEREDAQPVKPHILFLMVDEMDGRFLDPSSWQYKPPLPNIWSLAHNGANFRATYSSSPQCVPARASMLTGRLVSRIKAWDNYLGIVAVDGNRHKVDESCVDRFGKKDCNEFAKYQDIGGTFIDELADAGYEVTLWGKTHVGGGLHRHPGSSWGNAFKPNGLRGWREWARGAGIHLNKVSGQPSLTVETSEDPRHGMDKRATEGCVKALRAGLFLKDTAQFLYCSLSMPHPPYITNETYLARLTDMHGFEVPDWEPKREMHPADQYMVQDMGLWNIGAVRDSVAMLRKAYFSMCVIADDAIGEILAAYDKSGQSRDTYIVFVADHGEDAGEHRMIGKNSMYEASARIPLVLVGPGITPREIPTVASLFDVYPTILHIAGTSARNWSDGALPVGESLLPIALGEPRQKDYVVAEYHSLYSLTGTYMLREGDYKLIAYAPVRQYAEQDNFVFPPQLFNLADDPWERNDLAGVETHVVERMMSTLNSEVDMVEADNAKKQFDRHMFEKYAYNAAGGPKACAELVQQTFAGLDKSMIQMAVDKVGKWIQKPCGDNAQWPLDMHSAGVHLVADQTMSEIWPL